MRSTSRRKHSPASTPLALNHAADLRTPANFVIDLTQTPLSLPCRESLPRTVNQPLSRRGEDAVVVRHHESLRRGEDAAAPSRAGGRVPLPQEKTSTEQGSAVSEDYAILQGGEGLITPERRAEVRSFQA